MVSARRAHGLQQVMQYGGVPATSVVKLLEGSDGYLYYVSITGITGAAEAQAAEVAPEVSRIKSATDLPVIVGFGIKTPDSAQAIASIADGAVVGSAIVDRIARLGRSDELADAVQRLVTPLAEACRR